MIRGTCDKARLLDLVENFTLFSEHKAGLVKIIGQNHQLLGVNNAIASLSRIKQRTNTTPALEAERFASPVCYLGEVEEKKSRPDRGRSVTMTLTWWSAS